MEIHDSIGGGGGGDVIRRDKTAWVNICQKLKYQDVYHDKYSVYDLSSCSSSITDFKTRNKDLWKKLELFCLISMRFVAQELLWIFLMMIQF